MLLTGVPCAYRHTLLVLTPSGEVILSEPNGSAMHGAYSQSAIVRVARIMLEMLRTFAAAALVTNRFAPAPWRYLQKMTGDVATTLDGDTHVLKGVGARSALHADFDAQEDAERSEGRGITAGAHRPRPAGLFIRPPGVAWPLHFDSVVG
jgi:hypothetical protein